MKGPWCTKQTFPAVQGFASRMRGSFRSFNEPKSSTTDSGPNSSISPGRSAKSKGLATTTEETYSIGCEVCPAFGTSSALAPPPQ
jgi:hypothetical protein